MDGERGVSRRRSGEAWSTRTDDTTWKTFTEGKFHVLLVARSPTSTYRLLEAISLFRDDFRIEFAFTTDDRSAFGADVPELLHRRGAKIIDWKRVRRGKVRYHLTLCASETIDFSALDGPIFLLAHGLGFNKLVYAGRGKELRIAGIPPRKALRTRDITIALSHPGQREELLAAVPETAGRTVHIGDPTFEQMLASVDLRDDYREALGTGDRTLVTIASTWGPESVIGCDPNVVTRLLATLDADSYQVAAIFHPNIWALEEKLQIETWYSSALRAGLAALPPEAGWQATLIAADVVISDHGSLGLFAAGLDRPLLMAGAATETVPGTPAEDLARLAPTLRFDGDLAHQIHCAREQYKAGRERHDSGRYQHIIDRVFAGTEGATLALQQALYGKLRVEPLAHTDSVIRIPVPHCTIQDVTGYTVHTVAPVDDTLALVRFPVSVRHYASSTDDAETHVVIDYRELEVKAMERAAAITRSGILDPVPAQRWAVSTLTAHPGARLAVAPTPQGCLAVIRRHRNVLITSESDVAQSVQLIASAIYCCLLDGSLTDRKLTIQAGIKRLPVEFTIDRSAEPTVR
ncbi:hypothetical protein [Nocardia macrotermitis]|uniref:Uncharacterized protein n=1 Tax=Nocardia macrotermitis TaxID=2585198 RepID=A0A7K0DCC3_9NOCA|nr:hypothetical protein [Nocardia macrotermitis]MQY23423.1 hypothetical protein [Nocardia macrotermitis]